VGGKSDDQKEYEEAQKEESDRVSRTLDPEKG
jgi:hypothetical protein